MLPQSIYDHLKSLCDEYHSLQEQVQNIVGKFNTLEDEEERDKLKEDLVSTNDQIRNTGKSFMYEIDHAIDDICKGVDDSIVDHMKQKVLSPFDVSSDTSKYNRVNRLKELDEYVDTLNKGLCQ